MFTTSPIRLNPLQHERSAPEQARRARRGLAQAAQDDAQTQSYLSQFAATWAGVKVNIQALLDLPAQLQQARADLDAVRQVAIDAGDVETAQQAETLFADVQAHEDQAAQVAAQIQQYRDTWNQIAAYIGGTWGNITATVEDWWLAAKHAVGLGVLPLIPLALLVAAVAALGFVAVTGLAVLAWWQTTNTTIQGVKAKALPASALGGGGLFAGVSSTLMWGVAGVAGLAVLMLLGSGGGSRRR
jgi:hypothetical protein